jgi:two-component system response regulator YesN
MIVKIINCYYTDEINDDEITRRLHISRRHLDRIVREKYGKTLRALIYNSRISFAKQLLQETKMSLDMIAFEVGFSSVSSFKKSFVDVVGVTPTKYRKS